jgi:hypothetical protein
VAVVNFALQKFQSPNVSVGSIFDRSGASCLTVHVGFAQEATELVRRPYNDAKDHRRTFIWLSKLAPI